MDNKNHFREYITDVLEIPAELSMNLPRISMSGNRSIVIQNHHGILILSSDYVKIKYYGGIIEIKGDKLELPVLQHDELCVKGRIDSMVFLADEGKV